MTIDAPTTQETLVPCFSEAMISERVAALGQTLTERFHKDRVVALCVLRGACFFFADLVRQMRIPDLVLDFVGLSSYGSGTASSGQVEITRWPALDMPDAHCVVVEDIVDTGFSMQKLLATLSTYPLQSVTVCTLLDKRERRACAVPIDYACFEVESGFFVGYGLDYAQKYRHLPAIYTLTRA